jgi:phosphotriesterase-related protein
MTIVTVNGPIEPDQLGLTLAHEHIFCDTSGDFRAPPPDIAGLISDMGVDLEGEISLPSLGFLWREPQWSVSNQILESYEDAVEELRWAQRVGVTAVIDPTPIGLGRMPQAQRRLSAELGMHIVAGTGYYRDKFHPPEVATMSIEEIEAVIRRELVEGMDGTGIRAGFIGELGTSGAEITPSERKVLIAAARVQSDTRAPIMVHTEGIRDTVLNALTMLESHGADLEKVHICHVNRARWWKDVVSLGATIGLDCFGSSFSIDSETRMNPTDQARIQDLRDIFDAGLGDKVLVSNDICMKMRLHKYGGWGYDHIQTNLYPFMRSAGFTDAELRLVFEENPRRFLDTPALDGAQPELSAVAG